MAENARPMNGPGGRRGPRGPKPKVENPGKLFKRLMDIFSRVIHHMSLLLSFVFL